MKEEANVDQFEESHPIENRKEDEVGQVESNDANSFEAATPVVKLTSKIEPNENRESK